MTKQAFNKMDLRPRKTCLTAVKNGLKAIDKANKEFKAGSKKVYSVDI